MGIETSPAHCFVAQTAPRTMTRRATALLLLVAVAFLGWLVFGRGHGSSAPRTAATSAHSDRTPPPVAARPPPVHVIALRSGNLAAPVQDESAVAVDGSHAMLLGGLTAADTSTDSVRVVSSRTDRPAGRLPSAVHDS